MGYCDWSPKYTVNHREMDEYHQTIFNLINELHVAALAKKAREQIGSAINVLVEYTERHFADEELLMRQHNYPGYQQHKASHDRLISRVRELKDKHSAGDDTLTPDMFQFLVTDWLVQHILNEDKKYAPFVKKQR